LLTAFIMAVVLGAHELPPREYRGEATATVVFVSEQTRLEAICSRILGEKRDWRACQIGKVIYMRHPCNRRDYSDIYSATLCHELGHVNGWRH